MLSTFCTIHLMCPRCLNRTNRTELTFASYLTMAIAEREEDEKEVESVRSEGKKLVIIPAIQSCYVPVLCLVLVWESCIEWSSCERRKGKKEMLGKDELLILVLLILMMLAFSLWLGFQRYLSLDLDNFLIDETHFEECRRKTRKIQSQTSWAVVVQREEIGLALPAEKDPSSLCSNVQTSTISNRNWAMQSRFLCYIERMQVKAEYTFWRKFNESSLPLSSKPYLFTSPHPKNFQRADSSL